MIQRYSKVMFLLALAALCVFAISARCIENTSLRRAPDGDWHLYGEIHNETDVQGVEIIVLGTLLDAAGNTLATGQAPVCPYELSPGSLSVYDIDFHNSRTVPQPASYRVNVLSGRVIESALPQLDATLSNLGASRDGDTVTITGSVRANKSYPGDYSGCAAFYDGAGKVVQQVTIFGFGGLAGGMAQRLEVPLIQIPGEAVSVKFWLIGPGSQPLESDYRAVVSGSIPID